MGVSAGLLLWGAIVEVDKLTVERTTLRLPTWPLEWSGLTVAFIADFHLRDFQTVSLSRRAILAALEAQPDLIVLGGDFVASWKNESLEMLEVVFELLEPYAGRVFAVPGNRDYRDGYPEFLLPIFDKFGIKLLRNEVVNFHGLQIAGIDSANAHQADPLGTLEKANSKDPILVVWHEPDMVEWVPDGAALMLSGHSHGGQFTTPWGWAPVTSKNGSKYLRGFYPYAPTPVYVTRGLGTTGPPSRLFCTPEVSILTLVSA